MENLTLVRKYLGGRNAIGTPETELDFIALIRNGLPYSAYDALRVVVELSEETFWSSLGVAKRTAARRKAQAKRFKAEESELLYRLARVLAAATDVLGTRERARKWLLTENRALGGAVPIKLLDTGIGFQEVIDVLKRVDTGVYS